MSKIKPSLCDICKIETQDTRQELVPTRGYRYVIGKLCPDCQVTLVDFILKGK